MPVAEADVPVLWMSIVPVLVMTLDELPVVEMPPLLDVMVPLLMIVTGPGPVDVTAVTEPPAIVPLLVRVPPPGRLCGPTVEPGGMVVLAVRGRTCGDNPPPPGRASEGAAAKMTATPSQSPRPLSMTVLLVKPLQG
jgi:hypothetical protein